MSRAEILRHRPLRALLAAEVISTTGAQMTWLALPWFVLTTTGSPTRMTVVMIAELAGFAIAGLPAGTFVQRLGARRSMLIADAVRAPLMMLVPVLHWTGHLSLAALVVVALLLGVLGAPYFTAQRVILPELIGEDEQTMSQANALFQGAIRATMLLGPPVGGVLIGLMGAANVLVVDAATYVVSFLLVVLFVPAGHATPEAEESRGILAGLRFLVHEPLLRVWIPLFVAGDAAWQAFFAAVPVLTVERFGSDAKVAGALFAAFGAGALAGNFLSFRFLTQRVDGLRLIALSVPFQAAPLWLLPLDVGAADAVRRDPRERHRERHLQSVDPFDLDASHADCDSSESDGRQHHDLGSRHAARPARSRTGPVGVRHGPRPGRIRRGAVGLHARRRRRVAERARPRAARARIGLVRLELVGLRRECGERRLEEVVRGGCAERPREHAPETRRDDLRRGEPRGSPGADAARAGHELADRLIHAARVDGLLVLDGTGVSFDERLAQKARHLVPRERPSRFEARQGEHGEVESRLP